jgi:hypothetical protein
MSDAVLARAFRPRASSPEVAALMGAYDLATRATRLRAA